MQIVCGRFLGNDMRWVVSLDVGCEMRKFSMVWNSLLQSAGRDRYIEVEQLAVDYGEYIYVLPESKHLASRY